MSKILLVEDDSALSMGIEYSLKSENFDIDAVSTISDALSKLKNEKFDLVLLDVTLPDGNGYDLCKKVREKSNIPIIFLTACDDEVNIVLGLDIGGDDYITKPFRLRELISRINAVLRRKCKEKSYDDKLNKNFFVCRNLKVDILKAKIYKNDDEIYLTPIEYKLILMFIRNSNIVLERQVILQKLWDVSEEFVDDNTLSVYIKRLREKIDDSSLNIKHIKTIRGIGYKWVD